MKPIILIAEDDHDLATVLKQFLELEHFQVLWCDTGEKALECFRSEAVDICLLDVMMPGMDGFALAQEIRKETPGMPVVFLTARSMKIDRLTGLKLGADDYITKPFEPEELVLRIRNILSRTKSGEKRKEIRLNEFILDLDNLKLVHPERTQSLTQKEADLLWYLISRKNSLVKTTDLLTHLWGKDDYFLGRSMNEFISRLRKYLVIDPSIRIENNRGVGYTIRVIGELDTQVLNPI